MKYGIWNTALPDSAAVDALQQAGYSPLTARVLAGRGCGTPQQAQELLCADAPLFDPFLLREMDRAVQTVRQALQLGQRIAVFGDYDVDGITATCLLTDFLRGMGADCVVHIPGRLEEGYGLNAGAIRQLHAQGVRLIITVDCGITALEEAELCRELGVTLVVTDHHECKEQLPQCAAVVDPHRPDRTYPHTMLSGVGIAFKLAANLAFKAALPEAKPVLMEPIGELKVTIPDSYLGDVMGDLNKRRGRVMGMNPTGDGEQVLEAEVPMAEMMSYAIDLRSMTQSRGTFTFNFVRYEDCPAAAQEKAIAEAKALAEAE